VATELAANDGHEGTQGYLGDSVGEGGRDRGHPIHELCSAAGLLPGSLHRIVVSEAPMDAPGYVSGGCHLGCRPVARRHTRTRLPHFGDLPVDHALGHLRRTGVLEGLRWKNEHLSLSLFFKPLWRCGATVSWSWPPGASTRRASARERSDPSACLPLRSFLPW